MTAFVGGLLARRVGLPSIVGHLLAGVVIGPFPPGFVGDTAEISQLAEIGVIFLTQRPDALPGRARPHTGAGIGTRSCAAGYGGLTVPVAARPRLLLPTGLTAAPTLTGFPRVQRRSSPATRWAGKHYTEY